MRYSRQLFAPVTIANVCRDGEERPARIELIVEESGRRKCHDLRLSCHISRFGVYFAGCRVTLGDSVQLVRVRVVAELRNGCEVPLLLFEGFDALVASGVSLGIPGALVDYVARTTQRLDPPAATTGEQCLSIPSIA